jgi:hypothetical protein
VDRARDHFLADAGLAGDQHGDRVIGDLAHQLVDPRHLRVADDDLAHQRRGLGRRHADRVAAAAVHGGERGERARDQPARRRAVLGEPGDADRDLDAAAGPDLVEQRARRVLGGRRVALRHHDREDAGRVLGDHVHRPQRGAEPVARVVAGLGRAVEPQHHQAEPAVVGRAAIDLRGQPVLEVARRFDARPRHDPARDADHDGQRPDDDLVARRQRALALHQLAVDPGAVAAAGVLDHHRRAAPAELRVQPRHAIGLDLDVGGARSAEQQVRAIGEVEHLGRRTCAIALVDHEGDALGLVVARAERRGIADRGCLGLDHGRILVGHRRALIIADQPGRWNSSNHAAAIASTIASTNSTGTLRDGRIRTLSCERRSWRASCCGSIGAIGSAGAGTAAGDGAALGATVSARVGASNAPAAARRASAATAAASPDSSSAVG